MEHVLKHGAQQSRNRDQAMTDKLSDVRRSLQINIHSEEQATNLAHKAYKVLAPEAAKTEKRLEDSFRAIPVARKGETDQARQNAVNTIDEEITKSEKAGRDGPRARAKP
jgi:hypothetical protein